MTPEDANLVRQGRRLVAICAELLEAIDRLSDEKEAAEADADRLADALAPRGVLHQIYPDRWPKHYPDAAAALAAHAARRGQS